MKRGVAFSEVHPLIRGGVLVKHFAKGAKCARTGTDCAALPVNDVQR